MQRWISVVVLALASFSAAGGGERPAPAPTGPDLHRAIADGDVEQLRRMLAERPDLVRWKSDTGWTALHRAAHEGRRSIAALLLDRGADPHERSAEGLTPLHLARNAVAELLLVRGADVNARTSRGTTPLHLAALAADYDTVELLVARGADLRVRDAASRTPLDLATTERAFAGRSLEDETSRKARARIARFLRENGAE
jgi:ankyrin repeat protein